MFQTFTKVFGMLNAAITTAEDVAASLDTLKETAVGGVEQFFNENPIQAPEVEFTEELMDLFKGVASPYVKPFDRVREILNGQGIGTSCGWLSCAFAELGAALPAAKEAIENVPSMEEGEEFVRRHVKAVEDNLNEAIGKVNKKARDLQKKVAGRISKELDKRGLHRAGVFKDVLDKSLARVGLTQELKDQLDHFSDCLLSACNRTQCIYRQRFVAYINGPKEKWHRMLVDPLENLTEDVRDFVEKALDAKQAVNDMMDEGASELVRKLIPPAPIDCTAGMCRYCGPSCASANPKIKPEEVRPEQLGDQPAKLEDPKDPEIADPNSSMTTRYKSPSGWEIQVVIQNQKIMGVDFRFTKAISTFVVDDGVYAEGPGHVLKLKVYAKNAAGVVLGLTKKPYRGQVFQASIIKAGDLMALDDAPEYFKIRRNISSESYLTADPPPQYRTAVISGVGGDADWKIRITDRDPIDPTKVYPEEKFELVGKLFGSDPTVNLTTKATKSGDGKITYTYTTNGQAKIKEVISMINGKGTFYAKELDNLTVEEKTASLILGDVTFTAVSPGSSGNTISVRYILKSSLTTTAQYYAAGTKIYIEYGPTMTTSVIVSSYAGAPLPVKQLITVSGGSTSPLIKITDTGDRRLFGGIDARDGVRIGSGTFSSVFSIVDKDARTPDMLPS